MGVEVRPFGVRCNIRCQYCYQNPERDAGNALASYDLDRIKSAVEREGREFILFGGEPLLMPIADLEHLWAWGLERFGSNGVQTNGTLITDEHLRLFRQYKVHVGISVDGPDDLNDVRWAGTPEATRAATVRTQAAIEQLCADGPPPSLIVTLHRGNATPERLPLLHDWIRDLDRLGIKAMRLHLLEVEDAEVGGRLALTPAQNLEAMLGFLRLQPELRQLRFDVFNDMRLLLRARDRRTTCIWNACDPFTTKAVRGVEGNGQRSNCGRTNKDGIDFVKADVAGFERYLSLYQTPQESGGCRDCRFFLMCKGQCPGTAIDGDWRNRTEHCAVWMGVYETLEAEMVAAGETPLSLDPMRTAIERVVVEQWQKGKEVLVEDAVAFLRKETAQPPPPRPPLAPVPSPLGFDRLAFNLPEFCRISWVSDTAREVWEPRLRSINHAWSEAEWRSVAEGVRACAIAVIAGDDIVGYAAKMTDCGLAILPLEMTGITSFYRNVNTLPLAGQPFGYRVAVGRTEDLVRLRQAWESGDDEALGTLLGYPECCREFFRTLWREEGLRDTTWPMALATAGPSDEPMTLEVAGPVLANVLARWLGVRPVPHLPCRSDCAATVALGERMVAIARAAGFDQEMDWLCEILAWPVEWSSLHGIALIRYPVAKVSATTDATADRLVVRRRGESLPRETGRGLRFPYRLPIAVPARRLPPPLDERPNPQSLPATV